MSEYLPTPLLAVFDEMARPICERHYVELEDLLGPGRTRRLTDARRELYEALDAHDSRPTTVEIASYVGRHHATVLHALGRKQEAAREHGRARRAASKAGKRRARGSK